MQQRLFVAFLGCFMGLAGEAVAAPIMLDRSESVAEPRRDRGSGICGSLTKFNNQPAPLITIDDALGLINRPTGDPNIAGRVSRLFQRVNFSVGTGSEADFAPPGFSEEIFPYCQDPMAMPIGADDNNIALRLRGYINIVNTRGGQPVTFAIKCDDGCALWLGKSRQQILQANDDSPQLTGRRARWVSFKDPGLYPVELVYFQNATTGYLEWSQAASPVFSSDDAAVDDVQWGQQATAFQPLGAVDLYSSIIGSNPACIECGLPGMDCASGTYCGDGLCQACSSPDHCGPTCQTCPADRRLCSAGKCVQCTSDSMCPPGVPCDFASGYCGPTQWCTSNSYCGPPQICRPEGFCGPNITLCQSDAQCLTSQQCNCEDYGTACPQRVCLVPPIRCSTSAECTEFYYCDSTAQICRLQSRYQYVGGLAGCSVSRAAAGWSLPLLASLGFLFVAFTLRIHRRRRVSNK